MYQPAILREEEGRALLKISRDVLEKFVRHEHFTRPKKYSEGLEKNYGVLCTILKDGTVRGSGCSGILHPFFPIIDSAITSVISAAHENLDEPVSADELNEIIIEIGILTEPQVIQIRHDQSVIENIIPDTDGVIIRYGVYESFLPPQAWAIIKEKEDFLNRLCIRAGLTKDIWKDPRAELYKFQAQIFME